MLEFKSLNILLIENNLADANWISKILIEDHLQQVNFKHVQRLGDAIDTLAKNRFDAILLDLSLVDESGMDILDLVKQQAPELPIVVLTPFSDLDLAIESVRQGAQDCLAKPELVGDRLVRSIYYAIERQRTKESLRQQALMNAMLEEIRQSFNISHILQTTVAEVQKFLKTDRVVIYPCKSALDIETIIDSHNLDNCTWEANQGKTTRLKPLPTALAKLTSAKVIEDTISTPLGELDVFDEHHMRSCLILPIANDPQLIYSDDDLILRLIEQPKPRDRSEPLWGILIAYNYQTIRKWHDWELEFLQQLTNQVALAIEQSALCCHLRTTNQKLQQLAILDGLTGIANRRYFDLILQKEWQRLTREQKPLALILVDIDYFKIYNDNYGHRQGDYCLRQVAEILQQSIKRPADLVARYGGEEFALILPDTDLQGALFVAQRMQQIIAHHKIPHQQSPVSPYVTLSIGTAAQIPHRELTVESLIESADRSLYQAKAEGRNRINFPA